ncbi:hypothetical protein M569_06219, partial [Genlisea aurea]
LEDLITDDPFLDKVTFEAQNGEIDKYRNENGSSVHSNEARFSRFDSHIDIKEDAGSIIIPSDKVLDNWTEAPDMHSLCSLDRSFIFPGEQVQIFACLSAYKHDTEIITPFKVAAVMNKNGICKSPEKHNGSLVEENNPNQSTSSDGCVGQQDEILMKESTDISTGESLLRMESHKKQTEELLRSLENSYYFVRVAGSNEPLWSKRGSQVAHARNSVDEEQSSKNSLSSESSGERIAYASVMSDRGKVDTNSSGGLARGAVKCCSLPNGDLVILLQVNFGVQFISDPILEILQFEKHQPLEETLESRDSIHFRQDPYGQLLKWLLPLDNSILPLDRPISSPLLTPSSSIRSTSGRSTASGSASSQVFSFGHSRSHSMSSLPQNTSILNAVTTPNGQKHSNLEDRNQSLPEKFVRSGKSEVEDLLSFRGVPLQPERFLVQCGLEGILRPGRRWRRKIELIQPLKIDSFSVECNTEDLICVVNVSPAEGPDIVVYIDAITLVLEDASKGGRPLSLPVSCIEPGNGCSLPNLALRRGEEHSFILKPVATSLKQPKILNNSRKQLRHPSSESAASPWHSFPNAEGKESGPPADQYAVIVSCRCNYTDSMLVFKQPTNWQPCVSRDLMISVASEMSEQASESDRASLPSQVLTLQASNKTSENLTLTVLAPASLTSPSVVPLNNSPCSPSAEAADRVRTDGKRPVVPKSSSLFMGQGVVEADQQTTVAPNGDLGCTHLWLKSRVPLGCVPPQSTATIKLEVLPLTDGIITLDSLQIEVKEKGIAYVPEQSLKIHATSSIATGIL